MKRILSLSILVLFFASETSGQKTPSDFGTMAFWCFQQNRLDSLFKSIPTVNDLSGFAKELGIQEGTEAYSSIIKRYPLVTTGFKEKCYQIQRDSLDYKFSWANAKIKKIELEEKSVVAENATNQKPVAMTVVNINFTSGAQLYLLKFGDLHSYSGTWKPGNNLTLTIQYK